MLAEACARGAASILCRAAPRGAVSSIACWAALSPPAISGPKDVERVQQPPKPPKAVSRLARLPCFADFFTNQGARELFWAAPTEKLDGVRAQPRHPPRDRADDFRSAHSPEAIGLLRAKAAVTQPVQFRRELLAKRIDWRACWPCHCAISDPSVRTMLAQHWCLPNTQYRRAVFYLPPLSHQLARWRGKWFAHVEENRCTPPAGLTLESERRPGASGAPLARRRRSAGWAGSRGGRGAGSPRAPTPRAPAPLTCGVRHGCGWRCPLPHGTR